MVIRTEAVAAIDPVAVAALARGLRGQVLRPGDRGYDDGRRLFNAAIDRRPALVVRPADESDVRRAVLFALDQGLPLAVKGGGHNVAGTAVRDGGLTIDFSGARDVAVDVARREAVVRPGALLADLDRATQVHGLATPLGIVSVTGVAGLTLGGGLGWLNGAHGLACDNLLAARVVTADGDAVTASADAHPDLFWALRGGGGNFGVVTEFTYRLHPVGHVLAGGLGFAPERAREALRRYRAFLPGCPDALTTTVGIGADADGRPEVGIGVCWSGPPDEGDAALAPLRAIGPAADSVAPVAYADFQRANDGGFPEGRRHYWKASWLADLSDEAIDVLLEFAGRKPSAASAVGLQRLHGAAARVDPAATAFPHRRDLHDLLILAQWDDPRDTERHVTWARALFEAVRPFAERAVYVNDLGEEGPDRVREAFGANYGRLARIKAAYDPGNLFAATQNVPPAV